IRAILDRERITKIVMQSAELEPIFPPSFVPKNRLVWNYLIVPLVHPEWAQKIGTTTLDDVLGALDRALEAAVAHQCVGVQNTSAYYRPLAIKRVEKREAEAALKALLAGRPAGYVAQGAPYYHEASLNEALRTYQDYLYRHIYVKAGHLERPIIIHIAVALHP